MTIKECIRRADMNRPNQFSLADKLRWLTYIENTIIDEVINTHEGEKREHVVLTEADKEEELIVGMPYDELYTAYIYTKIDEVNGDTARYNNDATLFNAYYENFKKTYHRNHMPIMVANINV